MFIIISVQEARSSSSNGGKWFLQTKQSASFINLHVIVLLAVIGVYGITTVDESSRSVID